MAGLKIPVETKPAQQNLSNLSKGFKKVGLESVKAESKLSGFKGTMGKMTSPLKKLTSGFGALKIAVAGFIGAAALGGLTKSFLNAAKTSEGFNVRLKVLLGSAEAGQEVFRRMSKFAGEVPFQFEEIMESATALSGVMKGGVDEVSQWMPLIGDLAAATGLSIQDTTGQIIRMYSAGAASADMFRERGVLAMLGFQAGVSVSAEETRKRLMEAFEDPASQFAGAADALAKTWSGMMSMISDRWFQFRNLVMDAGLFDFVKALLGEVLGTLNELGDNRKLEEWAKATSDAMIKGFTVIIKGAAILGDSFRGLQMVWLGLRETWSIFVIGVLKGIEVVSSALSSFVSSFSNSVKLLGAEMKMFGDALGIETLSGAGESLLATDELSQKYEDIAEAAKVISDKEWEKLDATNEQLKSLAEQDLLYKRASDFLDDVNKKVDELRNKEVKPFVQPTLVPEKKKEISKEDLQIRSEFDKAFDKATLSTFQLESKALDELITKYEAAGVEKVRIDQWAAVQREEIFERESERSVAEHEAMIKEMEAGYSDLHRTLIDLGNTMDDTFASGFSNAFVDFAMGAKSAKQAFTEFATSFTTDILKMIAKQIILNALQSSSGGAGAGAGLLTSLAGLAGRASGGEVFAGQSVIVGERGPEQFVSDRGDSAIVGASGPEKFTPKQKGRVMPNGAGMEPPKVTIANILDPALLNDWANSSEGQDAIMNVISNNKDS